VLHIESMAKVNDSSYVTHSSLLSICASLIVGTYHHHFPLYFLLSFFASLPCVFCFFIWYVASICCRSSWSPLCMHFFLVFPYVFFILCLLILINFSIWPYLGFIFYHQVCFLFLIISLFSTIIKMLHMGSVEPSY